MTRGLWRGTLNRMDPSRRPPGLATPHQTKPRSWLEAFGGELVAESDHLASHRVFSGLARFLDASVVEERDFARQADPRHRKLHRLDL